MGASGPQPTVTLENFAVRGSRGVPLVTAHGLTLRPGRLHAVIGPNGAGKTSLLRGIVGILRSTGTLRADGQPAPPHGLLGRDGRFAYQPQVRPDADGITAWEFVLAARTARAGWLSGATPEDQAIVRRCMEEAGAAQFACRMLDSLSGGEAARVALAATLTHGAGWLLLDEPVAACDVAAARSIYGLLREMIAAGRASVVVVEHDLGLARSFADDVSIVAHGEIAASGIAAEVFAGPELERVYCCRFRQFKASENAWAVVALEADASRVETATNDRGTVELGARR